VGAISSQRARHMRPTERGLPKLCGIADLFGNAKRERLRPWEIAATVGGDNWQCPPSDWDMKSLEKYAPYADSILRFVAALLFKEPSMGKLVGFPEG
jgi:hypothetical protein